MKSKLKTYLVIKNPLKEKIIVHLYVWTPFFFPSSSLYSKQTTKRYIYFW